MSYTNEPHDPMGGNLATSERARARQEWNDALRKLELAGRRMAKVEGDPRANPIERLRYLLYVIESDAHAAMSALLTDFDYVNSTNTHGQSNSPT
jgi:hypothetical protein